MISITRKAKITPKKIGQFASIWKRNTLGITVPRSFDDKFEFLIIQCEKGTLQGRFVFPKSILVEKGVVSSPKREGKRGFRVYPPWDKTESRQAIKTQKWQVDFFECL